MDWTQDNSDYSWQAKDADGTGFRVTQSIEGAGRWRWTMAWAESCGIPRISCRAFLTAEEAKAAADDIASRADGQRTRESTRHSDDRASDSTAAEVA